jgi:hypothetical protein
MSNALPVPPAAAVRTAYHEELNEGQRSALLSWLSFTGTFALTRVVTSSIRAGRGPFRNLSAGGEHLHHYLWGIGMLAGVGAIAVRGEDRHRRLSVDLGVGGSAVAGSYLAARPVLRRLARDRARDPASDRAGSAAADPAGDPGPASAQPAQQPH